MEQEFYDVENAMTVKRRRKQRLLLIAALLFALFCIVFAMLRLSRSADPVTAADSSSPSAASAISGEETQQPVNVPDSLFVAFLDVGQGDCTFLRAPDGKTMLVDSGPAGSFGKIKRFLDKQNVKSLDVVVVTHMHEDHIGSMSEIIEHYDVGAFYISPFDIEGSAYAHLIDTLSAYNLSAVPVYASTVSTLSWSGDSAVEVRVLAPYQVQYEDDNDTSVILRVQYGTTAVLLAGDATELSERLTVKAQKNHNLHANVLKVGHHGSDTSTCNKFLSAVKPSIAVISVGAGNDYGHPSQSVLDRLNETGIRTLRTDTDGTIRILLDGTNVQVIE